MSRLLVLLLLLVAISLLPGCGGGSQTAENAPSADGMPAGGMPDAGAMAGGAAGMPAGGAGGPEVAAGMAMPGDVDAASGGLAGGAVGLPGDVDSTAGFAGGAPPGGYPDAAAGAAGLPGGYPPGYGLAGGAAGPGDVDAAGVGLPGDGYPGGRGQGAVPEPPKTLEGKAKLAMRTGREKEGLLYYYGHGLTTDQGASDIIGSMKWVSGLRRPAMAVRFGVGVKLVAKQDVRNNLSPIGTGGQGQGGGAPGGFDGGAGGAYGGGGESGKSPLTQYAGELGDFLIEELRTRIDNEQFGKVLKDAQSAEPAGNAAEGFAGYGGGFPGADIGEAGGGPGFTGAEGADAARGRNARGGRRGATLTSIVPGISFLGEGEEKALQEKAKTHGIDVVIIFHVEARGTRVGVSNDSKITVLVDNKPLVSSKELNNIKVQRARSESKNDGVEDEIKRIMTKIDDSLVMADLPAALNKERAVARVSALATGKHENPMSVLSEMKLYHFRELITDDDLIHGYDGLVGAGNGLKLAGGSEEERIKVLEKWLPK